MLSEHDLKSVEYYLEQRGRLVPDGSEPDVPILQRRSAGCAPGVIRIAVETLNGLSVWIVPEDFSGSTAIRGTYTFDMDLATGKIVSE